MVRLSRPHPLNNTVEDFLSSEIAHGLRIVLTFHHRQPGDFVIEHSGRCRQRRFFDRHRHRIRRQKFTQLTPGDISLLICWSDDDASDNLIEVIAV